MELDTGHHDAPKASIAACMIRGNWEGLFRVDEGVAEPDVTTFETCIYGMQKPKTAKAVPGAAGGKAIEDIYQKKTQLEHILLRPDTYIGSTEKQQQPLWVHDGTKMKLKTIAFVPGLYKIFDEILVNAADNKVRDPTMDTIKVTIDPVRTASSALPFVVLIMLHTNTRMLSAST